MTLFWAAAPLQIEREEQEQAKIAEAEAEERWGGQTTEDQWGETAQTDVSRCLRLVCELHVHIAASE